MISLLLALSLVQVPDAAPASPPPDPQEVRVPCETTAAGWVCRMPAVILRPSPPGTAPLTDTQTNAGATPPSVLTLAPPTEISSAEADRQARLIARCADASWYSLCLPGDRREARILRDAAAARAELRGQVMQLLSENKCDEAVRAALAGADMALAWQVRNFCAPDPASAGAASVPN